MSTSVDTRLVQIKLDSSDFQKNAEKTQKTIKQLEKDLELKDAAKGFASITKASDKVDLSGTTSQISSAIKKFLGLQKDATESISGITKAADKVDMSNIAAVANDVSADVAKFGEDGAGSILGLNTAADKVDMSPIAVAVEDISGKFSLMEAAAFTAIQNITNRFMDSAAQWAKNMAFGDISSGWDAYAEKTQSVQTMMAATRQDFEKMVAEGYEGTQIDWVESQMDKLAWYTDETSYNFLDMANNIGKFTSQGINLEDATNQMMGIANWAALAGANVQEASRAMYNIAQAMGTGAMKLVDWKSIENANMATKEFKEQVMEVAVAQGTLERVSEGIYHVVGANEEAIVSVSNFNSALSEGWFSSDVMKETFDNFGKFSSELYEFSDMVSNFEEPIEESASTYLEWIEAWNSADGDKSFLNELELTTEEAKALTEALEELGSEEYELSLRSFKAGQEAKTFGEALGSVHDAAKTAWGGIFQEIFGNYEQGKELWTGLANSLWDIFVWPLKSVRKALREWNRSDEYAVLAEGAVHALEVVAAAVNAFQEGILDAFGLGSKAEIVDSLKAWSQRMGEFLKSLTLTDERAEKIHAVASGLGKLLKGIFSIVGKIFSTILPPLGDVLGYLFEIIDLLIPVKTEAEDTGKSVSGVLDRILGAVKSALGFIPYLLGTIVDAIKMFKSGDIFGGIGTLITGPFESLAIALLRIFGILTGKDMQNAEEKVRENFFGGIIGGIRTGLEAIVQGGKAVIGFFKALPGYISDAWSAMNEWMGTNWGWNFISVFQTVSTSVRGYVDSIKSYFSEIKNVFSRDENGFKSAMANPEDIRAQYGVIGEVFYRMAIAISNAVDKIKQFFKSLGKSKEVEEGTEKAGFFARAWEVVKNIFSGLVGIFKRIGEAFVKAYNAIDAGVTRLTGKNLKQHFEEIKEAVLVTWEKIKGFFSSFAKDKDVTDSTEKVGLFQKVWEGLKKAGGAIADWAKAVFPVLQAAFQAFWDKVSPVLQKIKEGLGNVDWGQVAKGGGLAAIGIALMRLFKQTNGVMGKEGLGGIFGNVKEMTGSIKEYFSGLTDQLEQTTKKIKAQQILMIAGAVAILVASMLAVATLDSEGFTNGLTAISSFMVELAAFFVIVDDSTKHASDMTKIGAGLLILSLAIALLVKSMMKMKDASWDDLSIGLAALSGIMGLFAVFIKLTGKSNAKGIAAISAAMLILAKAVSKMVPSMLLMAAIQTDALKQGMIALGAIMLMIAGFMIIADKTQVAVQSSAAIAVIAAAIIKMIPSIIILGKLPINVLLQGGIAMAVLMAAFAGFMQIANKSKVALQNSLAIEAIALALLLIVKPVKELGELSWEAIAKGMVSIVGISAVIAGFLMLMNQFGNKDSGVSMIAAAASMLLLGFAMKMLVTAFAGTAELDWGAIGKGLAILGGAVLAIAIAGFAMSKSLPGLIGLSVVLASLGGMVLMVGAGFLMFAKGLAIIAAMGKKAGTAMKLIGDALAETIPGIMNAIASNIGSFLAKLLEGIVGVIDQIFPVVMELIPKVAEFVIGLFLGITQAIRDNENEIKLALQSLVRIVFAVIDQAWNSFLTMLRDNWPVFWDFLKTALSDIWDLIVEWMPKLVEFIFDFLLKFLTELEEHIGEIVDKLINIANTAVVTLTARVPEIVKILFDLLMSIIVNVIDQTVKNLPTIFQKLWELVDALITQSVQFIVGTEEHKGLTWMVTEAILTIIADLTKNIARFVEGLLVVIIQFLAALNTSLWTHKDELVAQLVDVVVIATEFAFDLVIDTINALADTLLEKMPEVRDALIHLADACFKALLEFFGIDTSNMGEAKSFLDVGANLIKGLISGIVNFGTNLWEKVKTPFVNLWNGIKSFFGFGDDDSASTAEELGENISQGLADGINEGGKNLQADTADTFASVTEGAEAIYDVHSPSQVFAGIGSNIMAGLRDGVNGFGGAGGFWSQVAGTFHGFIDRVKGAFKEHSPSKVFEEIGENVDRGFINGINNLSDEVDESSMGMAENAMNTLSQYAKNVSDTIDTEVEDPVITPVLDLSEIQNGSGRMANMLALSDDQTTVSPKGLLTADNGKAIGESLTSVVSSMLGSVGVNGKLSALASNMGAKDYTTGGGTRGSSNSFGEVINFNITATPNQDVNAIADAVERKLTRNIRQRGASF